MDGKGDRVLVFCSEEEGRMRSRATEKLSLRLEPELRKRVERVRVKMAKDPAFAGLSRITQSAVVRMALLRGLDVLEAEYK